MCNNCNCQGYDMCSIVGYLPVGFCCSKCNLYDSMQTCLGASDKISEAKAEKIEPIKAKIKDGVLKVVVKKKGKEVPLVIDLQKQFDSE